MKKRGIIFDSYDTAAYGWTLTPGWNLSAAVQKTNYVDKSGGDGAWDLSTAISDGIARYNDRTLTATFECSEGDRRSREDKINHMINLLDGMRISIELPDDEFHYIIGRVHVEKNYNDPAHAAVTVTATCEPWRYSTTETVVRLTASTTKQTARLQNAGRRAIVPVLEVTGGTPSVLLEYGTSSRALSVGTFQWPDLLLTNGSHALTYSGTGSLTITYREAVL